MMNWIPTTAVATLLLTVLVNAASAGFPTAFTRVEANDFGVFGIPPQNLLPWRNSGVSLIPPSTCPLPSPGVISPAAGIRRSVAHLTPGSTSLAQPADVATPSNTRNSEFKAVEMPASSDPASAVASDTPTHSEAAVQPVAQALARLPITAHAQHATMPLTARELGQYQASSPKDATMAVPATLLTSHDLTKAGISATGPTAVMSAVQAANQYEAEGNLGAAINAFHDALHLDETNRLALIGFARLKHRLGDLDGAIVTYRQSLKHHPNDAIALNDLAICYARMGQLDAAEESQRTALNLEPTSRRYINNLAKVLVAQDKDQEALRLLTAEYGEALANYNLGYIHLNRSAHEVAAGYFRATLELDPSFQPAAELLRQLGSAGHEVPQGPDLVIKPVREQPAQQTDQSTATAAPDPTSLTLDAPDVIQQAHARQQHRAGWNFLRH